MKDGPNLERRQWSEVESYLINVISVEPLTGS